MKRRDFIKFSALAATAAQANKIEGVTKTIFDKTKPLAQIDLGYFGQIPTQTKSSPSIHLRAINSQIP